MVVEQITYRNISPGTRKMIMFGLCLGMLGACFDGTIVGTCGPIIAKDLNGSGLYTWMVTAYLLCECVMIPIAGKLSDLYGRKPLFLLGIGLFAFGSILAGVSTNMPMMCICRGIQGIGGGIIIPVATAAIADLYSPTVRAKMQGMLGAIFGVGTGIGPIVGGWITENIDWHWCFYINVPLAAISIICTVKKFPAPEIIAKPVIDYRGIVVLAALLMDFVLIFECGGNEFQWTDPIAFVMYVLLIALIFVFIKIEKRAPEPVMSPKLLKNKTIVAGCIYMMLFGIGMMGAMTFASYFGIYVLFEMDTLTASYYSLFMVAGMLITSMISGSMCERTGYRPWLIVGPALAFVGLYILSTMSIDGITPLTAPVSPYYEVLGIPLNKYCIGTFILGFGLGCMATPIMAAVQNSSKPADIGMNTGAVNLFRSIGTSIGTALFTMLINAHYAGEVSGIAGVSDKATEFVSSVIGYLYSGFPEVANKIMGAFIDSVEFGFLAGGIIILLAAFVGFFIKARNAAAAEAEQDAEYEARTNTE